VGDVDRQKIIIGSQAAQKNHKKANIRKIDEKSTTSKI
jgi:hypothetical protein